MEVVQPLLMLREFPRQRQQCYPGELHLNPAPLCCALVSPRLASACPIPSKSPPFSGCKKWDLGRRRQQSADVRIEFLNFCFRRSRNISSDKAALFCSREGKPNHPFETEASED